MIRLFNVYYPTRTIVLLLCEALIVSGCFLLATALLLGPDTYLVLNYEYGGLKILGLTILTLLCSYYFDLYEQSQNRSEEHTSELQLPDHLVCRLLLEKKKNENLTLLLHVRS